MKLGENVVLLRPKPRGREELAFLPAALEITETPPSPVGRAIVWSVAAIFCLALAWACLGKVDMVAVPLARLSQAAGSRRSSRLKPAWCARSMSRKASKSPPARPSSISIRPSTRPSKIIIRPTFWRPNSILRACAPSLPRPRTRFRATPRRQAPRRTCLRPNGTTFSPKARSAGPKSQRSTGRKRKRRRRPQPAKRLSPNLKPPSRCSCRRPRFTGL